jgi:acetoin utilization protein AcuB
MGLEQLISPTVPALTPEDTADRALTAMEDNFLRQLPVVDKDDYVALVREDSLLEADTPEMPLGESGFAGYRPLISIGAHPFDAAGELERSHLEVLPVMDAEKKYAGSVTRDTIMAYMANNTGIANPGAIIVLEVNPRNYTLFEIARICENEDVIITHASVKAGAGDFWEVTLKLNKTTTDAVVASFERHRYTVREVYGIRQNDDDLTNNYNLLMAYLNM